MSSFRALVLNQEDDALTVNFQDLTMDELPEGDTVIDVLYSSLNYKDGLSISGAGKIARAFPMVPGIDLVGRVVASESDRLLAGMLVTINGNSLGEKHFGGYTQKARVQSKWCVTVPEGMTAEQVAALGTAGNTAMLALMAMERNGAAPSRGKILVTGATGGVGSIAIMLLAKLGYEVTVSTGREAQFGDYLRELGATEIIGRYAGTPSRPMQGRRWAGAIDNVGGDTLAHILTEIDTGGSVASIGNAAGADFNTTVFPFILRGVNLLGIDSNNASLAVRNESFSRLARDIDFDKLASITRTEPMDNLPALADDIVNNRIHGRVVIDVNA